MDSGLEVTLLRVVKTPPLVYGDYAFPVDTTRFEEDLEAEAAGYLDNVAWKLRGSRIRSQCKVLRGAPALEIVSYVKEHKGSMVAISTHGRNGGTHGPEICMESYLAVP